MLERYFCKNVVNIDFLSLQNLYADCMFSKGNNFCLHRQNFFIVLAKFYKVYEPCLTWVVTSNLNKKKYELRFHQCNADASGQKAHWESFFFFWISQCITNETQICKIYQYPRWNILFVGSYIVIGWIFHLLFIELYYVQYIIQNRNAEGLMQLCITEG